MILLFINTNRLLFVNKSPSLIVILIVFMVCERRATFEGVKDLSEYFNTPSYTREREGEIETERERGRDR